MDIDSFWEYSDPAASEARFRAALATADADARLELLTQIARTFSLRGQFDAAHAVLDAVERELDGAGVRPQLRYLLERGRAFNSSGAPEQARALIIAAWEQAQAAGTNEVAGLAVDAAHMVAITYAGAPEAIDWNRKGLALARTVDDPKARALIPAMLNNSAWDLHALGRYDEALTLFEEAQAEWVARGKQPQIQIARWSVARCLRSLGRCEEALAIQEALAAEHAAAATADGYVWEEMAENLAALGRMEEARPYFGQAYAELVQDAWLVEHEPDRLASLQARAGSADLLNSRSPSP